MGGIPSTVEDPSLQDLTRDQLLEACNQVKFDPNMGMFGLLVACNPTLTPLQQYATSAVMSSMMTGLSVAELIDFMDQIKNGTKTGFDFHMLIERRQNLDLTNRIADLSKTLDQCCPTESRYPTLRMLKVDLLKERQENQQRHLETAIAYYKSALENPTLTLEQHELYSAKLRIAQLAVSFQFTPKILYRFFC